MTTITLNDELSQQQQPVPSVFATLHPLNPRRLLKTIKRVMYPRLRTISNYAKIAFSPRYLFYTNVTISACLSGMGDFLEQHYEIMTGDLERWDPQRTRHMSISGVSVGIIAHHWYKFIDNFMPGRTLGIVVKKVMIDQIFCSPLTISTFFITMGLLEKKCYAEFVAELKEKAWKLYVAEWIIWPPAQFINFYLLPSRFRVLYDNTISLGYDVYTSQVKHSPMEDVSGGDLCGEVSGKR